METVQYCRIIFKVIVLFLLCQSSYSNAHDLTPNSRNQITLSFAPLVHEAASAVVNIYTKTIIEEGGSPSFLMDPLLKRFFGKQFDFQFNGAREKIQNSLGSGVIVTSNGMIVTNNHVIKGADKISVVMNDRREFDAELVGVDELTDLAILKIKYDGIKAFPYLEFSDSDTLQVGDLVLAIGNPFGVGQSVTSGIISALARTHVGVSELGAFIQTDAAINPGNSGGALISIDGRLAGINTAIFSNDGGSQGIGFAVPSNMVRFVIEGMESDGKVVRPWIGVWGQTITSTLSDTLGMSKPRGVLINQIWPNGSGERSGIKRGDVILAVNEIEVNTPGDLEFRFASLAVGQTAQLKILSAGKIKTIQLPLEPATSIPKPNITLLSGKNPLQGMSIANLSPSLGEKLKLNRFYPGVIILKVKRGSLASRMRFQPFDKIVSINNFIITSVNDVKSELSKQYKKWEITIKRNEKRLNLVVEL